MAVTSEDWLQAQYSVLGAALLDEKIAVRVLSETEERDYGGVCRTVYNAMHRLFRQGKPLDPVSVSAVLGSEYRPLLAQLMDLSPTAANVDYHIRLCREQARVLAIRDLAQQLGTAETTEDVRSVLEQANAMMVSRQTRKAVNMHDAMASFLERHTRQITYLTWPIREFNDHLFSEPGDFIIVGAEPSVGKTAFALQCAWHWAGEKKVGFFTFETSAEKLFDRKMSSMAELSMQSIKRNDISRDQWDRICMATEEVTSRKLELVPAAGMNTADIRSRILESGYEIVVIDYLQLISSRGSSRYEQVTGISIDLHSMAQSLGVTIVALSQLSRSDDDRVPKNSDLRESGQLEQDADIVIMLKLEKQTQPRGPRKVVITKNKEGELFGMLLDFDGRHQMFRKQDQSYSAIGAMNRKKPQKTPVLQPEEAAPFAQLPMDCPVPF